MGTDLNCEYEEHGSGASLKGGHRFVIDPVGQIFMIE